MSWQVAEILDGKKPRRYLEINQYNEFSTWEGWRTGEKWMLYKQNQENNDLDAGRSLSCNSVNRLFAIAQSPTQRTHSFFKSVLRSMEKKHNGQVPHDTDGNFPFLGTGRFQVHSIQPDFISPAISEVCLLSLLCKRTKTSIWNTLIFEDIVSAMFKGTQNEIWMQAFLTAAKLFTRKSPFLTWALPGLLAPCSDLQICVGSLADLVQLLCFLNTSETPVGNRALTAFTHSFFEAVKGQFIFKTHSYPPSPWPLSQRSPSNSISTQCILHAGIIW